MIVSLLLASVTTCPTQWQGTFCFLFVAAWTKRKAAGGIQPAGLDFQLQQTKFIANNFPFIFP
jgi:hypothetical protein